MVNSRKFLIWYISVACILVEMFVPNHSCASEIRNIYGLVKINLRLSENIVYPYLDGLIYFGEETAILLPAGLKLEWQLFGKRLKPSLYGWLRGISFRNGKFFHFYETGGSVEINLGRIKPVYFGFNPIINSLMLYSRTAVYVQMGYLNYGGVADTQKYGAGLSFHLRKRNLLGFETNYFSYKSGILLFRVYAQLSWGRFSILPEVYTSTDEGPYWLRPFYILLKDNVYGLSIGYEF